MKKFALSVLIPAYNDELTVGTVVKEADAAAKRVSSEYEIRVINDASGDNTLEVLKQLQSKYKRLVVSSHIANQGYGGTIRELYLTAKYEWLFTVPGDNQIPPAEVEKLIPHTQIADMIIGWRTNRHDPESRLRQSRIYNTLLDLLYGLRVHDVNSVRLMRTEILQHIHLTSVSAFVDAELVIDARRAGFRIIEIPIDHRARPEEDGAGGGSLRTIIPTVIDMIKYRVHGS